MNAARIAWFIVAIGHAMAGGSFAFAVVVLVVYWLGDYALSVLS